MNRVLTRYDWNKYNQTHYDHDNPPPKMVQGYKFNIFYPDLVDNSKPPTYTIENDGHSSKTCIIRFHAGPPYEELAFRIVNQEWEHSHKKGFKCTFEQDILHLYFNFKRFGSVSLTELPTMVIVLLLYHILATNYGEAEVVVATAANCLTNSSSDRPNRESLVPVSDDSVRV